MYFFFQYYTIHAFKQNYSCYLIYFYIILYNNLNLGITIHGFKENDTITYILYIASLLHTFVKYCRRKEILFPYIKLDYSNIPFPASICDIYYISWILLFYHVPYICVKICQGFTYLQIQCSNENSPSAFVNFISILPQTLLSLVFQ